jgi:hypothetical protein
MNIKRMGRSSLFFRLVVMIGTLSIQAAECQIAVILGSQQQFGVQLKPAFNNSVLITETYYRSVCLVIFRGEPNVHLRVMAHFPDGIHLHRWIYLTNIISNSIPITYMEGALQSREKLTLLS